MKEIKLTKGRVALVDDEDFEKLNRYNWYALNCNKENRFYVLRNILFNGKKGIALMHREILGSAKPLFVDHINGNGLDNRKENLRFVTPQQNQFNRKGCNKNNKLGIKGICWDKRGRGFRARIKINGKGIHLGCYKILSEAIQARSQAELKYFGEFARKLG